jgi:hypothetical protein
MHGVTTPYTLQHNGLAKRRNITLLDMIRSMLKMKKIPNTFLGEVVTIQHMFYIGILMKVLGFSHESLDTNYSISSITKKRTRDCVPLN